MRPVIGCLVLTLASAAHAGSLTGKLELPAAPDRPKLVNKGFLDRVKNPLVEPRPVSVGPNLIVVLDAEAPAPGSNIQVTWELAGDSFVKPVIGVPVGAEVVIKNTSKTARSLTSPEDPKLVPAGPINPGGPKSFRTTEAKTYTITDVDAAHVKGKLLVVTTPYIAYVDEGGKFEVPDLPPGNYKLRIYFFHPTTQKDGWLERPDDAVVIPAKGKGEITAKVPTGFPVKK